MLQPSHKKEGRAEFHFNQRLTQPDHLNRLKLYLSHISGSSKHRHSAVRSKTGSKAEVVAYLQ